MSENTTPGGLRYEPHRSQSPSLWRPLLDEPLRVQAQRAASCIAERMRDPDCVSALAELVRQRTGYPVSWSPVSLAFGDIGLVLLYAYIDSCLPGQGWDALTHRYVSRAVSGAQRATLYSPALFTGTAGMALALSLASKGGKHYQKTLLHFHQWLCKQVLQRTWQRSDAQSGIADSDYNVISGAAGILAYLVSLPQPDDSVQSAIERLLAYLTWLAEPDQSPGKERWRVVPSDPDQGNFNCGMAHGIPGPLAALALTWLAGYRYSGLRESIAYLAHWIVEHQVSAPWGIDWTDSIPLEAAFHARDWHNLPPVRPAWCYGATGVSRSLWLAGQALEDVALRQLAVEAIETVLRRPAPQHHISSPILCHGLAGLLQICLRFAHESESLLIKEQIPVLAKQLLNAVDPTSHNTNQDMPLDHPSWLTGAPGAALALLAASSPVAPGWDRALVIA